MITIQFLSAQGIEANKTKVRHRGFDLGVVISVCSLMREGDR